MTKAIVMRPRAVGAELAPADLFTRPDKHPVAVYVSSLAAGSKPSIESGLDIIAGIASPGADRWTLPWHHLRFAHTAALRAKIVDHYAPRTANRLIASMRGVLRAAWRLELVNTDDFHRAADLRHVKTAGLPPKGRSLELDEFRKLLTAAASYDSPIDLRNQALLTILWSCGVRRQELSDLDVKNYDAKKSALHIVRGKGAKSRFVYPPTGYKPWIEPWVTHQQAAGAVPMFTRWSKRGDTSERLGRGGVTHVLTELRLKAEVDHFTVHDLRRSYATLMLDQGVDLLQLQALMGHADLKTTKIYDRRGEASKRAASEKLPVVDMRGP